MRFEIFHFLFKSNHSLLSEIIMIMILIKTTSSSFFSFFLLLLQNSVVRIQKRNSEKETHKQHIRHPTCLRKKTFCFFPCFFSFSPVFLTFFRYELLGENLKKIFFCGNLKFKNFLILIF